MKYLLYSKNYLSKLRNNTLIEFYSKKIILVTGDPNSINSEIIYKSLRKLIIELKEFNYSFEL